MTHGKNEKFFSKSRVFVYGGITLALAVILGLLLIILPDVPSWAVPVVPFIFFFLAFFYLLMLDYVFRDAKRRGMNTWLWLVIVIIVPNFLGLLVYLLLRSPLTRERCPQCGFLTRSDQAFCPKCGHRVKTTCPHCQKFIDPDQSFCSYCGQRLKMEEK